MPSTNTSERNLDSSASAHISYTAGWSGLLYLPSPVSTTVEWTTSPSTPSSAPVIRPLVAASTTWVGALTGALVVMVRPSTSATASGTPTSAARRPTTLLA